jgi:hypothetical protein
VRFKKKIRQFNNRSFGIPPETRNNSITDGHKAGLRTKFGPRTPKTFRVMTKTALGFTC